MKKMSILERIKMVLQRTPGYSWCFHCGQTWDKVELLSIPYMAKMPDFSSASMFPTCEQCFDKLSTQEVIGYFQEGLSEWNESVDFDVVKYNIEYIKAMRANNATGNTK